MDPAGFWSLSEPWLAAEGTSGSRVLAAVGVLVWVAGLVWVVAADLRHARSFFHTEPHAPARDAGLRPR